MKEFLDTLTFILVVAAGVASTLTLLAGVGMIVYLAVVWGAPLW